MEYVEDELPQTFTDPTVDNFLHLRGANHMQAPLQVLPGSQEKPPVAIFDDERTGVFQRVPGELSVTLSGWERLRITQEDILAVARDGTTGPITGGGGGTGTGIDGGFANSVYGGTTPIDGGGA